MTLKRKYCLHWIPLMKTNSSLSVVAFGGLSGRVDQAFSVINQLYKAVPRPLYLISSLNISFLLHPGRNTIHAPSHLFGPCCGVIPTFGPMKITLEGFRWDLGTASFDNADRVDNVDSLFGGL